MFLIHVLLPVLGTHIMALRPSFVPLQVPLPSPPASSLADGPDPESDLVRAATPTVTRLLATIVIDPSFESVAASALVAELVDFAAACRLDYAASLVGESESDCPPSFEGECALGTNVLEDRQDGFECLAAAVPHLVAMLLMPEGDPDAPEGDPDASCTRHPDPALLRRCDYGTTLAALGFAPSTTNPSQFLRTDNPLQPFYILVYVNDFVFATADTEALALVKSELQKRHTCTDLAPPLDESVEPSGPYPELVGCLVYLITCTQPDHAYPLSILARYVAPGRHRPKHWEAAKRVLRSLCSTSGMGLVLGGWGPVVLTGHADSSWVDDLATQRSSQDYNSILGFGSGSWRSTCSSSVLSSSCETEIYSGAMAAQELRRLTYLLTDLGERPLSPPVFVRRQQGHDCVVSGAQTRA
ncbi:unnamed protein product [Closterium sp. NIES-54]